MIKRLDVHGGIYLHLLKGLIDTQSISVNQTLNLLEIVPTETKYRINNENRTNAIEFRFETEIETGTIVDMTFDRRHLSKIKLLNK